MIKEEATKDQTDQSPTHTIIDTHLIAIPTPKISTNLTIPEVLIITSIPGTRLAGPDRTDFSVVRSQSKRPYCEIVSIFGPDLNKTFIAQAFINKLG